MMDGDTKTKIEPSVQSSKGKSRSHSLVKQSRVDGNRAFGELRLPCLG